MHRVTCVTTDAAQWPAHTTQPRVIPKHSSLFTPYDMSSAATTSKAEDATKATDPPKEGDQTLPHLSVLEEDDEFEEFVVQGEQSQYTRYAFF